VSSLAPTLEAFFKTRLQQQRRASSHTVNAYRDTFRLLFKFIHDRTGKPPSDLCVEDLNATVIGDFLNYLEEGRGNSVRTRNSRLAALHSFFRFASFRHPEQALLIQRVQAIPRKGLTRPIVSFLTEAETAALLAAPRRDKWIGRRDHALLLVAVQTGLRVSELTSLTWKDVELDANPQVQCQGKGRKDRQTPLRLPTVKILRAWKREVDGYPGEPVFPGTRGTRLTTDAVEALVLKYANAAQSTCPSLATKRVSPHVLRHTCAMRLLEGGVDIATIALWLGHELVTTTQIYLHANLAIKEKALERTAPLNGSPGRYRPTDAVLAFLEGL
jgi:integrase/recombinase XerD